MKKIDQAVMDLYNAQGCWEFATFDAEPNVVPCAFKTFLPDGRLAVAAVFLKVTVENVQKNHKVAVSAYDGATMRGYQIKGTAEYKEEGPEFEQMKAVVAEKTGGRLAAKGIVLITPERVIDQGVGPNNNSEL